MSGAASSAASGGLSFVFLVADTRANGAPSAAAAAAVADTSAVAAGAAGSSCVPLWVAALPLALSWSWLARERFAPAVGLALGAIRERAAGHTKSYARQDMWNVTPTCNHTREE